jgi:AcrR family transcriptional regulator
MSSTEGQRADAPEPVEGWPAAGDASDPTAPPTTQQRILYAGAELFGRQGFTGTGVKQIVAAAQAPFGSIYHHFPGGKEQLGEEVIRVAGGMYGQLVNAVIDEYDDVAVGIEESFRLAGVHLADSGWLDACPIATMTLETASSSEPMRAASHEVFEAWFAQLAARYEAAGIDADRARSLAIATLSLLEGAFIFARAARTTEALDAAGRQAADAVRAALAFKRT